MKIYKPVGSKGRFLEIFQGVNKVKLNEGLFEAGSPNLNPENVLNMSFSELKNNRLNIEHSNTQASGDESFIELMCTDKQGNNITFTFVATSTEGDQEGVFSMNNVLLYSFTYDSADGEDTVELAEDTLKNFNAQHANEMLDVVEKYVDVESSVPQQDNAELEEAVKLIDAIKKESNPFGGGSEKLQTGKGYADEKPTNDSVRVKSPELDKFVQEDVTIPTKITTKEELSAYVEKLKAQGNYKGIPKESVPLLAGQVLYDVAVRMADKMLPMGWDGLADVNSMWDYIKQSGGMTYDQLKSAVKRAVNVRLKEEGYSLKDLGLGESEDDDVVGQELNRFKQEIEPQNPEEVGVEDEPVPEISDEKKQKIWAAYNSLVAKNKNPNYSPTTAEVIDELDRMEGVVKPKATRTFPAEAEPYLQEEKENKSKENKPKEKKEKEMGSYSPFKQLGTTFKPKSQSLYPKKKKKPQSSVKINEVEGQQPQLVSMPSGKYVVVDNDFNRAHYKDMIGKVYDSPPGYAHVKKVEESTDRDKYEDVVFLQGDEAFEPLERLDREGPDAALEYLKQWHNPGQHMGNQELGHGSADSTYEKDGYIMSWNPALEYIGLQYDSSKLNETETYGDEDISGLPEVPSGYGEKGVARKDMAQQHVNIIKPVEQPAEFGEGEEEKPESDGKLPGVDSDEDGNPIPAIEPDFDKMGMGIGSNWDKETRGTDNAGGDGMSLEPQGDEVEQIAQDKAEVGELIPGGKGEGKSPLEFSPDQIKKGMKVEMEHTDDPMLSLEIALDHLTEDPEYYTEKETPEASAQFGAAKDTEEGGEGDDKETTDMLLGFKPHNVGDEIEDDEAPEEVPQTPEVAKDVQDSEESVPEELPDEKKEIGEDLGFSERDLKDRDPATWHQIQIAKKTIRMPGAMANVMGGMTKEEAREILKQRGIKFDEK